MTKPWKFCYDRMCDLDAGHAGDHEDIIQGTSWSRLGPVYVEVADANPERVNNGCQIYKAN